MLNILQCNETKRFGWAASMGVLALAACATSETKPDDMSAAEHQKAAIEEDEKARTEEKKYDPTATVSRERATDPDAYAFRQDAYSLPPVPGSVDIYNPTEGHLKEAAEHRMRGAAHLAAARALHDFEDAECGLLPPSTRAQCPLLTIVTSVKDVPDGVQLSFADDVNLDAVSAHVLCHLAFARTAHREGMNSCPLYLQDVTATRSGKELLLKTTASNVEQLRQRTKAHIVP